MDGNNNTRPSSARLRNNSGFILGRCLALRPSRAGVFSMWLEDRCSFRPAISDHRRKLRAGEPSLRTGIADRAASQMQGLRFRARSLHCSLRWQFTSSERLGTVPDRSSCVRRPRPLCRADTFQSSDARRFFPRTAGCPRNRPASQRPNLVFACFRK